MPHLFGREVVTDGHDSANANARTPNIQSLRANFDDIVAAATHDRVVIDSQRWDVDQSPVPSYIPSTACFSTAMAAGKRIGLGKMVRVEWWEPRLRFVPSQVRVVGLDGATYLVPANPSESGLIAP